MEKMVKNLMTDRKIGRRKPNAALGRPGKRVSVKKAVAKDKNNESQPSRRWEWSWWK